MLLNIIHPHTFKQEGDTLMWGPLEERHERDVRISTFVTKAMDCGNKVISYEFRPLSIFDYGRQLLYLEADPLYSFLFDDRIVKIYTTNYGIPLPEEKPKDTSDDDWMALEKIYTSPTSLGKEVQEQGDVVFIGGLLENCIANAADHFDFHYRTSNQRLFYVPELCISFDEFAADKIKEKLDDLSIFPLSYEAASELSVVDQLV